MSSHVAISASLPAPSGDEAVTRGPSSPGAGNVFGTVGWLAAWENTTVENVLQRRYLTATTDNSTDTLAPLYLVAESPFWRGYEQDAGVSSTWDAPVVYLPSMYSFRSPLEHSNLPAAPLVIDAARS